MARVPFFVVSRRSYPAFGTAFVTAKHHARFDEIVVRAVVEHGEGQSRAEARDYARRRARDRSAAPRLVREAPIAAKTGNASSPSRTKIVAES